MDIKLSFGAGYSPSTATVRNSPIAAVKHIMRLAAPILVDLAAVMLKPGWLARAKTKR